MKNLILKYQEEAIVVFVFMFCALGFNVYRVESDGLFYFSFLENFLRIPNPETASFWQTNHGFYQAGCAFLNAPFYIAAYAIEQIFHIHPNFNGITLRQIAINLSSNFYICSSLILIIRTLKRLNFKHVTLATLSILFSTSTFTVSVVMPSFNHTADIFINTLFLYLFIKDEVGTSNRSFWLGAMLTLMTLIRYLNFLWIIPICIYYLLTKQKNKIFSFLKGFCATSWIMPILFKTYNGGFLVPLIRVESSVAIIKTGLPLLPKYALKYLVHPLHGIFIWSPVTLLSLCGFFAIPPKANKIGWTIVAFWSFLLFILGYFYFWYAGWSFSNRYLVGLFPILCIGLAAFLEKYGRKAAFITLFFTFFSIWLYFNWRIGIINGEFSTPKDMIEAWAHGTSRWSIDGDVNFKTFFYRIYETCRYKYIFKLLS